MLRLAGREADGAIINWLSADDVHQVAGVVDARPPAARSRVVARIFVCPSENDRAGARRGAASPSPPTSTCRCTPSSTTGSGRGAQLQPMWDAWKAGDRKAALAAIPDEVVDELIVHGSPEQCRATIQRYFDNGVDHVGAGDPAARPRRHVLGRRPGVGAEPLTSGVRR